MVSGGASRGGSKVVNCGLSSGRTPPPALPATGNIAARVNVFVGGEHAAGGRQSAERGNYPAWVRRASVASYGGVLESLGMEGNRYPIDYAAQ